MARVLLVEDDPDQLELRRTILMHAGHQVDCATNLEEAMERCGLSEIVVMDLIPGSSELLQALEPDKRIIVLSGRDRDQIALPRPVNEFLLKPCATQKLLDSIAKCCLFLVLMISAEAQSFHISRLAEVVAALDLRASGTDWATEGHEAALATLSLDGKPQQNIMLYMGDQTHTYSVFLGPLAAGEHRLTLTGSGVEQSNARFSEVDSDFIAHAPILYARPNTIGKFTDIPLITYCERLQEDGYPVLQYTVIYSNEDAGTSTRALMARWGRATDIEWVYKAFFNPNGTLHHATIQAASHKEVLFKGKREGLHPVLITWTDNNNVADDAVSPVRYQIPPFLADLSAHSREQVMDEHPFAYLVMAKELLRERKLRPYAEVEGQNIGDPRNYLYFEARVANHESAINALVRLRGDQKWFSGDLGHADYAIARDGWVRTTVELPPGVKPGQIAEIGFECSTVEKKLAGVCELLSVSKCFFLDQHYVPGPDLWTLTEPQRIPAGQIWTFALK